MRRDNKETKRQGAGIGSIRATGKDKAAVQQIYVRICNSINMSARAMRHLLFIRNLNIFCGTMPKSYTYFYQLKLSYLSKLDSNLTLTLPWNKNDNMRLINRFIK